MKIFALLFSLVAAELKIPGFTNPIYSAFNYTGSRILETNYSANNYSESFWYQTATVDKDRNVFLVDTNRSAVIEIPANTRYHTFPTEGFTYTGKPGRPGHRDGSLNVALFRSPQGIAHVTVGNKGYLYIADTGNHCIRRVDVDSGRVETVAGIPGTSGHRDGDGRKALFDSPTSVGVDAISGLVFVHDARSLVRMLNVTVSAGVTRAEVSTLVSGACRAVGSSTEHTTIQIRQVRCQTKWVTEAPGSTEVVNRWTWPEFCLGNSVTCSTRYSDEL